MTRCLYCQEDKSENKYQKSEHVLPQSFGVFEHNFTLRNIVCDDCNHYFGNNLELALARDSMEGIARFSHGIKSPGEFKSFGRNSRIVMQVVEGDFEGVYVYREYSSEVDKIIIKPLPQIGFLIKGKYKYFLLDEIPERKKLEEEGFDGKLSKSIRGLAVELDTLQNRLKEKDIRFEVKEEDVSPPSSSESLLCQISATVDQKIFRAIAKIAFNYLAYHQDPAFLHETSFDVIRRYIRYGEQPTYRLILTKHDAILEDEPVTGQRRLGHIVTVNWAADGKSILAQASLLNRMTYCVSLAVNYPSERRDIRKGHFFDVANHRILELGARPKENIASHSQSG